MITSAFIAGLITGAIITLSGMTILAGLLLSDRSNRTLGTDHAPDAVQDHGEAHGATEGSWSVGFNHDPQLATEVEQNHA